MSRGQFRSILQHFGRALRNSPAGASSDRQLLRAYALHHDEAAFATLLERHGPMVFGLCRRLLDHEQDAEDAFQATFLVLARKADSAGWHESLAPWLYEVAYRVACKARAAIQRRRGRERETCDMPDLPGPEAVLSEPLRRELQGVLDEELHRLPSKYRSPLVLCYLEGKTNAEAALALGWTKGTVSGRLARAREILRGRLGRRGLTLSAAALSVLLASSRLNAALPPGLALATLRGVTGATSAGVLSTRILALAEQWTRQGLRSWLLTAAAWLCLGTAAAGVILWARSSDPRPDRVPQEVGAREDDPTKAPPRWHQQALIRADGQQVHAVAFTRDGASLATAGGDGTVKLWDVRTGKLQAALQQHGTPALALAFSRDSRTLTSVGADGVILVRDMAGKRTRQSLRLGPTMLASAALSADGKTLAATLSRWGTGPGRPADEVLVWNVATGKLLAKLRGHRWQTMRLAFAPNDKMLATTGVRRRLPADGPPDEHGDFLLQETKLWDLSTGKEVRPRRGGFALAFSPDGKTLASSTYNWTTRKHGIDLWNVTARGKPLELPQSGDGVTALSFSPDGRHLAAAGSTVQLREVRGGKLLRQLRGHKIAIARLVFSRNGRVLAAAEESGVVHIWVASNPR